MPSRGFSAGADLAVAATTSAVYANVGLPGAPGWSVTAFDARTGHPLAWHAPRISTGPSDVAPVVTTLGIGGSRLFIGGGFSAVAGKPRPGIAALDTRTGSLLAWRVATARTYAPGAGVGDVEWLTVGAGEVLTAGHDGFGAVDARTGRIVPWMYKLDGVASSFGSQGSVVYLAGDLRNRFTAVDRMTRNNLASIDVATGRFTSWAPDLARYVSARPIVPSGRNVLIGGSFCSSIG